MRASSSEFEVIGGDAREDIDPVELQLAEEVLHNFINADPATAHDPAHGPPPTSNLPPGLVREEPPSEPAVSACLSNVSSRRTGRKRKHREQHSSSAQALAKVSKATEWRKKQEKEIAKNDQILKNFEAEVKDKEMSILVHQAVLEGNRRQKSFDYASKMASFDAQRSDIEAGMRGLESIDRCQQMAQYKKAQVLLLKPFQSYINTLTEQILAVNKDIMEMNF